MKRPRSKTVGHKQRGKQGRTLCNTALCDKRYKAHVEPSSTTLNTRQDIAVPPITPFTLDFTYESY